MSSFTEKHYKQGGTDFKSDQHFFGPFLKYEKHVIPAKGAFVSEQNKDFIREENLRRIEKQMEEICILAKQTGITKEEIEELLHLVYEEN